MSRRPMYVATVTNEVLGKSRVVKGRSELEVAMKVAEIEARWAQEEERLRQRQAIQDMKEQAALQTDEALALIDEYRGLLRATLPVDDRLDWESLYDRRPFHAPTFDESPPSEEVIRKELGVPTPSPLLELLWPRRKARRLELEAAAAQTLQARQADYQKRKEAFERRVEEERAAYERAQAAKNAEVDQFRVAFERGDAQAIERYVGIVLDRSLYPEGFNKDVSIAYVPDSKVLIVDFQLPGLNDVPRVVGYRFVQTRKAIQPIEMKQREFNTFYESIVYQTTLRTIHEVFEADYPKHILSVVFNGWVSGIDRATGKDFTACLISCQASRDEFMEFDLSRVDPKESVRALKGLVAGPLVQLAPVRPIMHVDREDHRFVEAREILVDLESSQNLVDMPWDDFEHLVRELFAKIFRSDGGEVRVTRASRDGGVDAVAFDPDPIRGGKFVIQAKRYNGLVPVSAVRDLYGTMINEGAVKGILVTTGYFGHDSREFVKDKPISLIDGANLVHLFHEHGHNVRIELKNAGRRG